MQITLTTEEQTKLQEQLKICCQVRQWKRCQALLLLAQSQSVEQVARSLRCSRASIYNWAAAWKTGGLAALDEEPHRGRQAFLDQAALSLLDGWRQAGDPQQEGYAATNWTVPLRRDPLAKSGYLVSQKTLRRDLHQLGWRWNQPKYVLGRPDPAYAQKSRCRRTSQASDRCGRASLGRRRDDDARISSETFLLVQKRTPAAH